MANNDPHDPKQTPSWHSSKYLHRHPAEVQLSHPPDVAKDSSADSIVRCKEYCMLLYCVPRRWCMLLYDVARGWFRLTPESTTKPKTKAVSAVSNGILALVFGIVPMPVIIRWIGWGLCWVGFVYILLSGVPLLYRLPRKTRVVMGFILVILFVESLRGTAYRQWKEETAAAQDGYIHSNSIGHGQLALRIGKDGGPIPWDKESLKMFPDTSFRIERGNDGVELSTEVHDKSGNLAWIIQQGSSQKRKDALKGMMNTGFADPAFPFGASIT